MARAAARKRPGVGTTAVGIARRNYGRNHAYRIDGLKVPGVTTITGHFKSGALAEYPGKQVANYAVRITGGCSASWPPPTG